MGTERKEQADLIGGIAMAEEQNQEKRPITVKVEKSGMSATINVSPIAEETYGYEDLVKALEAANIVYGIDKEAIRDIVDNKRFYLDVLVARGVEPEDGTDGYYEYLFETDVDVKPKILADGSVDYKSMGQVPVVEEGTELVHYHPAVAPKNGMSVFGNEVIGKRGKDLMALKGKGFKLSEDKTVYSAALTGKVTIKGNVLEVSNVLVIQSDVSISTGGVSFAGDVVIKGNVLSGAEVRANGNIEVDGCVEAATLIAGKNVVLKNGMQGNGKGSIHAGKDVSGKFFEQVTIEAKGNVSANSIMHCNVKSEEAVNVAGKFGIIVGGRVEAYREIEATMIGNMNEVKTVLEVGTGNDLYARMERVESKLRDLQAELQKLRTAGEKVEQVLAATPEHADMKNMKMNIMRSKIAREAAMTELKHEKEEIAAIMAKVTNPRIFVLKSIYPGVVLTINGVTELIKTENYNVFYQKNGVEIEFMANL